MAELSSEYAGDLSADEAWSLICKEPNAQIVDVRTAAEWAFVGGPDLSSTGRDVLRIEWQRFPAMTADPDFVSVAGALLRRSGTFEETPVLFLCRSGARSRAAAIAMTRAGFKRAYNIAGGFEGDLDGELHRGQRNGWKAAGLPWKQS